MRACALGCLTLLLGCGEGVIGAGAPTTVTLPAVVTVELTGTGNGRVVSTPPGIDCPGTCVGVFPGGTEITLTATPDASSRLVRYSLDCSGATCTLAPKKDVTVEVDFEAPSPTAPEQARASGAIGRTSR